MTVFKQRAGLLWSARSWGALGLLLTLMMVVVGCIPIDGVGPVQLKCVTPPSGLLEWWPLDETSGNVVNNLISHPIAGHGSDLHNGTTNPGAISSTGPAAVPGMVNGALQFDGVDDFVEVPDGSGTLSHGNSTSDFTIDAWVKVNPQDASGVRPIVDKRFDFPDSQGPNVPTRGYAFYLYNGNLGFQLADDMVSPPGGLNQICDGGPSFTANCTNYGSTSPNVADGQWHHVAVTVQRTGTPTVTLYVDGSPVLTKGARTGNANSSIPLLIGSGYPIVISKPFFKGAIDELEIFDRALTQQEIQGIFKAGLAGKCKPQPSPTADLGDAPDSTNHANKQMTTYTPPVPARFPTVFDTTTGAPPGPKHLQPKRLAWLGKDVSFEDEADLMPDQDSVTNIDPPNNVADRDGFDDGVKLPIAIPMDCGQTQFDYIVTSTVAAKLYVNVWFDFNRDGDWDDPIQKCPLGPGTTGSFTEWAVQNELINVPIGTTTFTTPVFGAANPTKGSDMWMRITLTDQPIAPAQGADGSGPAGGYKYGETEDYLLGLKYSELCGVKFNDLDGNGKQDANEPGLANWVIEVTDANGNFIGYAVTNAQGQYCIVVPSPGTYTVSEQPQSGWTQTAPPTPGTYTVTVPPAHTDLNFGNQQKGTARICILKFEDLDEDGIQDTNEPGLGGWQFNVSPPPLSPTTSPVTTQPDGSICFSVSAPGTYTITEVMQPGWTPTKPDTRTVTVAPGQRADVSFGNKKQTYEICGIKWNDLDGDGVKDPNEPGLPGWTINMVFGTQPNLIDVQTTTDANGQYCFTGLQPGTYTISETLQSGWIQTFPPSPGKYTVTVPPSVTNINFGNKEKGVVVGCVTPPQGMVAWWPLDETNGATVINDIAPGFHNQGTPVSGPIGSGGPNATTGKVAGALDFPSNNTYIRVPNHPALDFGTSDFSIEAWVYAIDPGVPNWYQPIVDKTEAVSGGSGFKGYRLYIKNGSLVFDLSDGTNVGGYQGLGSVPYGSWTLVYAYRVGSWVGFVTWSAVLGGNGAGNYGGVNVSNNGDLLVGGFTAAGVSNLAGVGGIIIDELEIFNRPLTQAELEAIYNAGPAGKCKAQP